MTIFSRDLTRRPLMPMMMTVGLLALPAAALGQTATTPAPGTGAPAMGAQTAPSATMATPSVATPVEARRASKVIGSSVYNEQGDSIGTVDDLLLTAPTATPTAVLSVGGFLGIGARLVAVPMNSLTWHADRERWVMAGATKESLQARPAFEYDARG